MAIVLKVDSGWLSSLSIQQINKLALTERKKDAISFWDRVFDFICGSNRKVIKQATRALLKPDEYQTEEVITAFRLLKSEAKTAYKSCFNVNIDVQNQQVNLVFTMNAELTEKFKNPHKLKATVPFLCDVKQINDLWLSEPEDESASQLKKDGIDLLSLGNIADLIEPPISHGMLIANFTQLMSLAPVDKQHLFKLTVVNHQNVTLQIDGTEFELSLPLSRHDQRICHNIIQQQRNGQQQHLNETLQSANTFQPSQQSDKEQLIDSSVDVEEQFSDRLLTRDCAANDYHIFDGHTMTRYQYNDGIDPEKKLAQLFALSQEVPFKKEMLNYFAGQTILTNMTAWDNSLMVCGSAATEHKNKQKFYLHQLKNGDIMIKAVAEKQSDLEQVKMFSTNRLSFQKRIRFDANFLICQDTIYCLGVHIIKVPIRQDNIPIESLV